MPDQTAKIIELLEKQLTVHLFAVGASQGQIASALGKSKTWVNDFLKNVPDRKRSH